MNVRSDSPPLALGPLLQAAFDVFRAHLGPILLAALLVAVPVQVIAIGAAFLSGGTEREIYDLGSLLSLVGSSLTGLVAAIAALTALRRERQGEDVTLAALLAAVGTSFLPVLGLSVVAGVATGVATLAFILPGLYVLVRWVVALPALVLEEQGIVDSLRRSWDLISGRWWQVFGFALVGYLVPSLTVGVISQILTTIAQSAAGSTSYELLVVSGAAGLLGTCLAVPFTSVFLGLLFLGLVGAPSVERAPAPAWPAPPSPPADVSLPGGYLPPRPSPPAGGVDGSFAPPPERPPAAE